MFLFNAFYINDCCRLLRISTADNGLISNHNKCHQQYRNLLFRAHRIIYQWHILRYTAVLPVQMTRISCCENVAHSLGLIHLSAYLMLLLQQHKSPRIAMDYC